MDVAAGNTVLHYLRGMASNFASHSKGTALFYPAQRIQKLRCGKPFCLSITGVWQQISL